MLSTGVAPDAGPQLGISAEAWSELCWGAAVSSVFAVGLTVVAIILTSSLL